MGTLMSVYIGIGVFKLSGLANVMWYNWTHALEGTHFWQFQSVRIKKCGKKCDEIKVYKFEQKKKKLALISKAK